MACTRMLEPSSSVSAEICRCLQGLWFHGNLLTGLPESMGALSSLRALSAVGNQLTSLPETIDGLQSLTSLELAGNRLKQLPEALGSLGRAS